LLDQPSGRLLLAHGLESYTGDIDQAEKVDFHLGPDLLVTERLELAAEAVASIVDDDIDTSEMLDGRRKGIVD